MLKLGREKYGGNTATIFCKALLAIAELVDNVQATSHPHTSTRHTPFTSPRGKRTFSHALNDGRNMTFRGQNGTPRINIGFPRKPSNRRTSAITETTDSRPTTQ
ncbi:hypothetical protein AB6A40_010914 [Gnathostoma spinigerum]|uniref:Uncharacterized protein n=1 Tax=Gnathostoma spinigerum TaxID=75299 RepID=A0ABD6EXM6_9BILA